VTFSIDTGSGPLAPGTPADRDRFEAQIEREWRDQTLEPGADARLAAEVIQDDDASAGTADAVHLAGYGNRIGTTLITYGA